MTEKCHRDSLWRPNFVISSMLQQNLPPTIIPAKATRHGQLCGIYTVLSGYGIFYVICTPVTFVCLPLRQFVLWPASRRAFQGRRLAYRPRSIP